MKFSKLQTVIENAREEGFPPSLQMTVVCKNKTVFKKSWGAKYKYYDLASLTKIMVTVPLIMKLYDQKKISLNDSIGKHLGFLKGPVGNVKIKDLLSHHSGLVWWRPYFQEILKVAVSDYKNDSDWNLNQRSGILKRLISKEKISKSSKCVYSDPDFFILGWLIEEKFKDHLDIVAQKEIFEPLGLSELFFIRSSVGRQRKSLQRFSLNKFAPTAKTKQRGLIRGVVEDDNAWSLGGVSAHAGLFGTLDNVSRFGQALLKGYEGKNQPFAKASTIKLFAKRAVSQKAGDWALGFMLPSKPTSSAGQMASPKAFGHTGYTGTSLWINPALKTTVTILTNRVHPKREDVRFTALRGLLHDCVWCEL